ncbi:MAG: hypothetical protein QXP84_07680 [Candidatus Korarchaeum sp.]
MSEELSICSVSHFLSRFYSVEEGSLSGKCIFCGFRTERGFPKELPGTFTATAWLQAGDVICPSCYLLLKREEFRRKSWVASKEISFKTAKETLPDILNPPEPPFVIYITIQGKKHGWVQLNQVGVNYSRDRFFVGFEDSVILINRSLASRIHEIAKKAREKGAGKQEILSVRPKVTTVRKTGEEVWRELLTLRRADEGVYEVVVRLM